MVKTRRVCGLLAALVLGCSAETSTTVLDASAAVDAAARDGSAAMDAPAPMDLPPPLDIPAIDVAPRDAGTDAASGDAGCTTVGTVPYAGRTTNAEFTDPGTCSGCPSAFTGIESLNVGTLAPGATTLHIGGVAAGAHRCEWYVLGGSCGVSHGVAAVDPDGAGTFSSTIPVFCGTNVVQVVCSNDAGARVLVRRIEGTQCAGTGRDLRVTLSWDELARDMELHLLRAPHALNSTTDDCTWFTCMGSAGLDWGVAGDAHDNPTKDIDNTGTLGPENVFLERATAGTYHVMVEYWGSGEPSTSDVDVTIRERTVARLRHTMLPVHSVWYVGTVSFPAGTFTPVDSVTPCASNWMASTRGCDLPLP